MRGKEENLGVVEVSIDGIVEDTFKGEEEGEAVEDGEEDEAEVGIEETVMLITRGMTTGILCRETMGNMTNMKRDLLIMT